MLPARSAVAAVLVAASFWALSASPAHAGDGNFAPAATIEIDNQPVSVAVWDFNNDGNEDLVTANLDSSLDIMQGYGTGNIAPGGHEAFYVPYSVAVGDFNNDGNEDVVTANYADGMVSISLGSGDDSVGSAGFYAVNVGTHPASAAVGDFNRDGNEDLATANKGADTVSVLKGNGDGSFTILSSPPVGANPSSVAVADFDGDGFEDIATANSGATTVSVLKGNGLGSFTTASTPTVGTHPSSLAVGDFNSDGKEDLATANYDDGTVSVLKGNGLGSFTTASTPTVGTHPSSLAVGDFNSDGNEDLATANYDVGTVSVLKGNGLGSFTTASTPTVGTHPSSVAVGDFNSDGNEDLATANKGANTVSVLEGNGPAPLAGNLLTNGGFEGPAPARVYTQESATAIPGWQRTFGAAYVRYGTPPQWGYPDWMDSPRFRTGGLSWLSGGDSTGSGIHSTAAFQIVDVSSNAATIDAGVATAHLSAYLGGMINLTDAMNAKAQALSSTDSVLGTLTLGPVTAADRHNLSTMLPRSGDLLLPSGTRKVKVALTSTDTDQYSSAMADNVKLTLSFATADVYRFWSSTFNNAHFYTANKTEADNLKANDPNWTYEGVAFKAIPAVSGACANPTTAVYRFFSSTFASHFYTASQAEADSLKANDPNWNFEGVAYCAYPTAASGTTALYRFWSPVFRKHFYTASTTEADGLKNNDPNWNYEGIVSYVLP